MSKLTRPSKMAFVVFVALALVVTINAPSQAASVGGHGFGGGHPGGAAVHHGFEGHHFDGHRFDGHFDRRFHGRFGFGFEPVFPYYGYYPPAYTYEAPTYWYYCPSYGAYYPNVASCPEAWVPVPTS